MRRRSLWVLSVGGASAAALVLACGGDDSNAGGDDSSDASGIDAGAADGGAIVSDGSSPADATVLRDSGNDSSALDSGLVCEAGIACGGACVLLDTTTNCGACDYTCFSGQTCGTPDAGPDAGDAGDALTCIGALPAGTPRLIAPLSGMEMTTRRPTFAWQLPGTLTDGHAQICSDAACAHVVADLYGAAGATAVADLPAGGVFWRVAGHLGSHDAAFSKTWTLFIPQVSAPQESSPKLTRDLNGDGLGDVVLAGPSSDDPFTTVDGGTMIFSGVVGGIYFGRSTMPSKAPTPFNVPPGGDYPVVAYAGDNDGDGFGDLVFPNEGNENHVSWGGVSGPNSRVTGVYEGSITDNLVVGLGDTDGDGHDDFAVSAQFGSDEIVVYPGVAQFVTPPTVTNLSGTTIQSPSFNDEFGKTITACGDIDGDGYADIAVGAPISEGGDGTVYVYSGSSTGLSGARYTTLVGSGDEDGAFGYSMDCADVDHDGHPDLIVGAGNEANNAGNVYVFRGTSAGIAATPKWVLHGGSDAGLNVFLLGKTVVAADFDGDGYGDIATSAGGTSSTLDRVLIFHGSASGPSTTPSLVIANPDGATDGFGALLATPLDATGDGISDLVVGDSNKLSIHFFAGSATGLPATQTESLTAPTDTSISFFAN